MKNQQWTIKEIISWSIPYLKQHQSPSPRLDTELLLAYSLGCQRIDLYVHFDKPLCADERSQFRDLLKRRARGEPVAYIIGEKEFYGLKFKVSNSVLIPRPETEHLVEAAEKVVKAGSVKRILDLGTGSGCIGITLKKLCPEVDVVAWDISAEALQVAKVNSERLEAGLSFECLNGLDPKVWEQQANTFDLICSNPPYIAHTEELPVSVRDFEPHQALYADADGLVFYQTLAQHAISALRNKGQILCEIGFQQGASTRSIFADFGWQDIKLLKDLAGLDRVLLASRPSL